MSRSELVPRRSKWLFSRTKLYGWLFGLLLALMGGVMCAVPAGAVLGVPVVVVGLMMSISFSVAMSASRVTTWIVFPLFVLGLWLIVIGRQSAPVQDLIDSFVSETDTNSNPNPTQILGFPLILMGTHLLQLALPWIRDRERLSFGRSALSMLLILGGSIVLLVAAILTGLHPEMASQPYWLWLAVPLALGIGVGLRRRFEDPTWLAVMGISAVALPLIWKLLI